MVTRTLLSIEEYDALPEREGVKYELNEGELITVVASPRLVHNRVRDEVAFSLREFVHDSRLGERTIETDFELSQGRRRPVAALQGAARCIRQDAPLNRQSKIGNHSYRKATMGSTREAFRAGI
jgi:Putative restriction endonuclease